MGKIKNNVITKGFSGSLGEDITFRQVDGKTIFAKRTLTSSAPTAKQQEVRDKFTEAAMHAGAAIGNPDVEQEYKVLARLQGFKTAYVAAMSDFLTEPEIGGVFTRSYKGNVGDKISMTAKIPYKIKEIDVRILSPDGTVLESGKAVANELKWLYVATVANAQVKGSRLELVARDRLDKEVTMQLVL